MRKGILAYQGIFMRSDAREAAFKIIYSKQFNKDCSSSFRNAIIKGYSLNEDEVEFSNRLIETVQEKEGEILQKLDELVKSYSLDRLFVADKSILMLAICEILYFPDVPNVVAVNEAVGLAKKYSSETSADFVNGVLASLINA